MSEESKLKSDTLDSSTMSSFDTDITSGRRKPVSFSSKKYSSSDDSDSDGELHDVPISLLKTEDTINVQMAVRGFFFFFFCRECKEALCF